MIDLGTIPRRFSGWTQFKALVALKGLIYQYEDGAGTYVIYAFDGQEALFTTIWTGAVPSSIIDGGYSQATNDADKSDFETNFLPNANKGIQATQPTLVRAEGRAASGAALVGNPALVGGSDGTNARSLLTDNTGRLILAPSGAGALKGFAAGEAVLAATTIVPIRSTTYTEQAANATRSVSSASANDTSAGTGARTLRITYYTVTMTGPFTTDVTMNGVTAVATSVSDICFIEKIEVLTVGSTGSNVGIITLFVNNAGGGGTIWTIAATANQTKGAHHYCPTGKTCYITGLLVGIKGADTTSGFLRAKNPTVAAAAEIQISDVVRAPSSGQSFRAYGTAIPVPGPSRITVFAAPDSSSSRTYYGSFDYYEE